MSRAIGTGDAVVYVDNSVRIAVEMELLEWVASGKSLSSYCNQEGKPHIVTIMRWVSQSDDLKLKYTQAMKVREEVLFDEIIHIADTPLEGVTTVDELGPNGAIVRTTVQDMTKHREMQISSRKWVLSRMNPKKYGDKVQVAGHDAGPLTLVARSMTPQEAADAYAATLQDKD